MALSTSTIEPRTQTACRHVEDREDTISLRDYKNIVINELQIVPGFEDQMRLNIQIISDSTGGFVSPEVVERFIARHPESRALYSRLGMVYS